MATKQKGAESKSSYKWTEEDKMGISMFLRDNFDTFKKIGGNSGKKTLFLLRMKNELKLQATDRQLVNGFDAIIRKFKSTKETLASTGFGIDPEKDRSIEEGYIKKQCPYFHILDEVMGERPNISPPCTLQSGQVSDFDLAFEPATPSPSSTNQDKYESEIFELKLGDSGIENDSEHVAGRTFDKLEHEIKNVENNVSRSKPSAKQTNCSPEVQKMVKQSFAGLGIKRKTSAEFSQKNPVTSLLKILSDKSMSGMEVDDKRLKLEREKFEYLVTKEKGEREVEKERQQFELNKLQLQQDFELEKLKLQIELAKLNQPSLHH